MCSVVGYVGKNLSRSFVMEGLTRVEYRGYDSAGFVCIHPQTNRLIYAKSQGGVKNLINNFEKSPIDGFVGMGHTRWSTHGIVSTENAHPHFDCSKNISIIHNGIIENFHELKKELESEGHTFRSKTDTEVVAHLLEEILSVNKNLKDAAFNLVNELEGAYAFACLFTEFPEKMLVVRKRSPLCIGCGEEEMFVSSDLLAFAGKTNKVLFMPDESFAIVTKNNIELYDFSGKDLPLDFQIVDIQWAADAKQGYEHFMLKEIYEQKKIIQTIVAKYKSLEKDLLWNQMNLSSQKIKNLQAIDLFACGTSWHAASIAKYFFEKIAYLPTRVYLAHEFKHMSYFPNKASIAIGISQSGETADTLEAIRLVKSHAVHTIAVVNVVSSTLVRETDGFLQIYAGPEVAVASTKAFSAQLSVLYLLANHIALERGLINAHQMELAEKNLLIVAEIIENAIEEYKQKIEQEYAPLYSRYKNIIFTGRQITYPFAQETALKLKEISYIFTDVCPSGELKHGSLALIDEQTPVFLFSSCEPHVYQKIVANAQEIKARSGHLAVFAFEKQDELLELADTSFILPKTEPLLGPLAMTGLMHFFVYQIAKELNRPIDKPRNLAKSLTVE